jgi:hypothetical protein
VGLTSTSRRRRCARAWLALLALALLAVLAGCRSSAPGEPPGAWWAARTPALRALLAQLAQLEGTPIARRAHELAALLPACDVVGVHDPAGAIAVLAAPPRCLAAGDPLERLLRADGGDLVFALPRESAAALRGALRSENGALALDLRWPDPPAEGALRLLVPGDTPAGPDRLASMGRLASLRVRPRAGVDLAALVPEGSQADRLFRLKSGLLASAVLDGTWEGAVYLPERAGGMPGVALALGFSLRDPAVAAMERFIADLAKTWPVHRSAFARPEGEGACLSDLNVLPDLAPCYVATSDALVVGWNATSLARALQASRSEPKASEVDEGGPAFSDAPARLDLDLALIRRADDLLARAFPDSQPPLRWPWDRVLAHGGEENGALVLRMTLVSAPERAS